MNVLSSPVVAMAGISLYVGLYHLLIFLRRPQNRTDLTFALLCFSTVFYDAFCVGLYNASTVAEGAHWQRAQLISMAFFVPAFLWFVSEYTHQKPGMIVYSFFAYYLLAAIVQLVDRSNLTWLMDRPSIKHVSLPFDLSITYNEVTFGPFTAIQSLVGVFASTYILILAVRYFRNGNKKEAMPLILALGFMYAAAASDTLVGNGIYEFIYLMEYAFIGTIMLMAFSISNMVLDAITTKDALNHSEERFRSLVETINDWMWEVDANGIYTYASPKVRDLLGYEPEEILGRTPFDFMPAEEAERVSALFQEYLRNRKPITQLENIVRHKDGRLVTMDTNGVPFFDGNGNLAGYRGIDRDITERRQVEKNAQQREAYLRAILDNIPFWLWLKDPEGRFLAVNKPMAQDSGFEHPEVLVGKTDFDVTTPELAASYQRDDRLVIESHKQKVVEESIIRNGIETWAETFKFPIFDSQGNVIGTTGFARDITERKQVELEREELIASLESKNAELERFTYTVSHDLKSPLVTINGFLGFLEKDARAGDMEKLKNDFNRIREAVEKMRNLLSDLLELSRIGRVVNTSTTVSFRDLTDDALALVHGQLEENAVRVVIQPGLPQVFGDRQRLTEVLQNLIENAAKYMGSQTDPCIQIGQQGEEEGKPIFYVKDNGIGIAPEFHERIFGLFNKLDTQSDGTGIGLALVKRIVEIHGGRIWVESEAGKGATFNFTLPRG